MFVGGQFINLSIFTDRTLMHVLTLYRKVCLIVSLFPSHIALTARFIGDKFYLEAEYLYGMCAARLSKFKVFICS